MSRGARVVLQVPDDLLPAAPALLARLRAALPPGSLAARGAALLADASFAACCVDEVGAAHVRADAVVHVGHACLSPVRATPAAFVFGARAGVDAARAGAHVARALEGVGVGEGGGGGAFDAALLVWDPDVTHALPAVLRAAAAALEGGASAAGDAGGGASVGGAAAAGGGDYSPTVSRAGRWAWPSPAPGRLVVPSLPTVILPRRERAEAAPAGAPAPSGAAPPAPGTATTSQSDGLQLNLNDDEGDEEDDAELVVFGARTGLLDPDGPGWPPEGDGGGGGGEGGSVESRASAASAASVVSAASAGAPGGGASRGALRAVAPGRLRVVYLGDRPARLRALLATFGGAGDDAVVPVPPTADGDGDGASASAPAAPAALSRAAARLLAARYRGVEAVRGAGAVGLVAGTLGVARVAALLARLRRAAARAGVATYTLLVGKPSPAKLGNFPECDAFVVVACAEATLPAEDDARAYPVPLVTPHEALVAWGGPAGARWTGRAQLSAGRLVDDARGGGAAGGGGGGDDALEEGEDAPPVHSLVAGARLVARARARAPAPPAPAPDAAASPASGGAIIPLASGPLALAGGAGAGGSYAGAYLAGARAWRGLAYEGDGGPGGDAPPGVGAGRVGTPGGGYAPFPPAAANDAQREA